jgi:hypothetical protein
LWNETLSWFHDRIRIKLHTTGTKDWYIPEGIKYEPPADDETMDPESSDVDSNESLHSWNARDPEHFHEWRIQHRVLIRPEPREYVPLAQKLGRPGARQVDLRKDFRQSGLQIIFKLASIHLTPEKPEYDGGTWHVEGALNEHICATALYYYDQENITDCYLSFRQSINRENFILKPEQVGLGSEI